MHTVLLLRKVYFQFVFLSSCSLFLSISLTSQNVKELKREMSRKATQGDEVCDYVTLLHYMRVEE
jgi:hypothetical protein